MKNKLFATCCVLLSLVSLVMSFRVSDIALSELLKGIAFVMLLVSLRFIQKSFWVERETVKSNQSKLKI